MLASDEFLRFYLAKIARPLGPAERIVKTEHSVKWKSTQGTSFILSPWLKSSQDRPIISSVSGTGVISYTYSADQTYGTTKFGIFEGRKAFVVDRSGSYYGYKMPADASILKTNKQIVYYGSGWQVAVAPRWNETEVTVTGPVVLEEIGSGAFQDEYYLIDSGSIVVYGLTSPTTFPSGETAISIWCGDLHGEVPLTLFKTYEDDPSRQDYYLKSWSTTSGENVYIQWDNIVGPGVNQIPANAEVISAGLIFNAEASGETQLCLKQHSGDLVPVRGLSYGWPGLPVHLDEARWTRGTTYNYLSESPITASGEMVFYGGISGEYLEVVSKSGSMVADQILQTDLSSPGYRIKEQSGDRIFLKDWVGSVVPGKFTVSDNGLITWPDDGPTTIDCVTVADASGNLQSISPDTYCFDITDEVKSLVENTPNSSLNLELDSSLPVQGQGIINALYQSSVPMSIAVVYDIAPSVEISASGEPTDHLAPIPPAAEAEPINISAKLLDTRGDPVAHYPIYAYVSSDGDFPEFVPGPSGEFTGTLYDPYTGIGGSFLRILTDEAGYVRMQYSPPSADEVAYKDVDLSGPLDVSNSAAIDASGDYDIALEPQPAVAVKTTSVSGDPGDLLTLKPIIKEYTLQAEKTDPEDFRKFVYMDEYINYGIPVPGTTEISAIVAPDELVPLHEFYPGARTPNADLLPGDVPENSFMIDYEDNAFYISNLDVDNIGVKTHVYPFWVNRENQRQLNVYQSFPAVVEAEEGSLTAQNVDMYFDIVVYLYLEYHDNMEPGKKIRKRIPIVLLNPLHKLVEALKYSRG